MFTEKDLLQIGFEQHYSKHDVIDVYFSFGGVKIWNFNDKYWIIDMLDQNAIEKKYRTLEDLNVFFSAIGKPLNIA